eukprot:CAMPEP_0114148638 /NCGR_PEP_ID=MMETSP0043_2-20121206/21741_1 /TAXON_ID=464988 /ORGANISM="Hemiselmis andersenii, Strain CCMP644" /LENGTH=271 /DNA_ID=CAMNT_0001243245 /DNA_START=103 /DNA_END=915 /DNA_ORIENTATION=+
MAREEGDGWHGLADLTGLGWNGGLSLSPPVAPASTTAAPFPPSQLINPPADSGGAPQLPTGGLVEGQTLQNRIKAEHQRYNISKDTTVFRNAAYDAIMDLKAEVENPHRQELPSSITVQGSDIPVRCETGSKTHDLAIVKEEVDREGIAMVLVYYGAIPPGKTVPVRDIPTKLGNANANLGGELVGSKPVLVRTSEDGVEHFTWRSGSPYGPKNGPTLDYKAWPYLVYKKADPPRERPRHKTGPKKDSPNERIHTHENDRVFDCALVFTVP